MHLIFFNFIVRNLLDRLAVGDTTQELQNRLYLSLETYLNGVQLYHSCLYTWNIGNTADNFLALEMMKKNVIK